MAALGSGSLKLSVVFQGFAKVYGRQASNPKYVFLASNYAPCSQVLVHRSKTTVSGLQKVEETPPQDDFRERFVPLTRLTLHRKLMEEKDFLTDEEKLHFNDFAKAMDSAIDNKYRGLLLDLKMSFDPVNPDKETMATRQLNKKQLLDNEFFLLTKLSDIMEKANFYEIPRSSVAAMLSEHKSRQGMIVSVDLDKYDVLRYWALGRESPEVQKNMLMRIFYRLSKKPLPRENEYYKRVVLAVRLKTDDKLLLKIFKEVPVNELEMLVPEGRVRMSKAKERSMDIMVGTAVAGVVFKVCSWLAHYHINWSLVITAITGLVGFQIWNAFRYSQMKYLQELNKLLYFKNIANNRGAITLLIDRASDEQFKEALLVYTFLLTHRPPSYLQKGSSEHLLAELGGISQVQLEKMVENWVLKHTGYAIEFESDEAVRFLKNYGLLREDDELLRVVPFTVAVKSLPSETRSWVDEDDDEEIDAFDRAGNIEEESEYKEKEKAAKKTGWKVGLFK